MARCYNACVPFRQPSVSASLPDLWLVSDARNDDALEAALLRLPRGSGLIFRHYHLLPAQRRIRFEVLARLARQRGHRVVLSGTAQDASRWGADGAYGPPSRLSHGPAFLRLVTAHSLAEIARANRMRADAILLSPVFSTRSHPGADTLGPLRFRLLAARARVPVIALGGMNPRTARRAGAPKWATIQGLAEPRTGLFPRRS